MTTPEQPLTVEDRERVRRAYLDKAPVGRQVVRRFGSGQTHLADNCNLLWELFKHCGAPFWGTQADIVTLCGAVLHSSPTSALVAMQPGSKVTCIA